MKQFLNWVKRSLDHDLSLGYARQLLWLFALFVLLFLIILATLFAIDYAYGKSNIGNVNIPGTAFLLLTDPGNLSGVLPSNHSWFVGIIYAFIAVAGAVVFGGLLISLLSNSVQRRIENIQSGNVYYNLNNHIVIIGYDTIVPYLVKQVMDKWPDKDVLILTKRSPLEIREALNKVVDVTNKHLIIYSGQRSSMSELRNLQPEVAHEIFIIGNRQSEDHDALNIDCLSKLVAIIEAQESKAKPTVNILLENPATQTILQSTNLAAKWQKFINVIPFSFYETWARQVLNGGNYPRLQVNHNNDEQLNIVIFGMSEMGTTLAVEAAHALHFPRRKDGTVRKTIITFVSLHAKEKMTLFRTRYRQIFEIQSSTYIDFIGKECDKETDLPIIKEMPPTCFKGKDADFLDIEFEFVRGNALSEDVHQFLIDRIEKNHYQMALFACTGKDATDMNIALYLPESVLRESYIFVWQHHSGLLLDWLRQRSEEEAGLYSKIYPFGMEDSPFDLQLRNQQMGVLINYYYWYRKSQPDTFKEGHLLTAAELEKAKATWNDETSVANQWSSSYCCMSFEQKLAQWGITSLDVSNIEAIKDVVDHNIEELSYIEHNRWNMEKLLLGFRKPHPDEQAEIDNSRREYADSDKLSKHDQYKRRHIHSYLCSFDDLADITWKGMDKEKDNVRKIDYDMLRQLPWIIRNNN